MAATTEGLIIADISKKDPKQIVFKHHTKDVHRSNSLSNNATMYVAEDKKHLALTTTLPISSTASPATNGICFFSYK